MDPTAALVMIRNLAMLIHHATDTGHTQDAADLGEELAITIDGLDRWLARGGPLPTRWNVGAN